MPEIFLITILFEDLLWMHIGLWNFGVDCVKSAASRLSAMAKGVWDCEIGHSVSNGVIENGWIFMYELQR